MREMFGTYLIFPLSKQSSGVVYDGSAMYCGCSINQDTHTGPNLLVPLLNALTRFRLEKYRYQRMLFSDRYTIGMCDYSAFYGSRMTTLMGL